MAGKPWKNDGVCPPNKVSGVLRDLFSSPELCCLLGRPHVGIHTSVVKSIWSVAIVILNYCHGPTQKVLSYLAQNGPWNVFTTSMTLNLLCSLLLFIRVSTFVLQTTAQKPLSPSQRTSTDWTYSNLSCSAQEHLFIVLHFIVLYICCITYQVKARVSTRKILTLALLQWSGTKPTISSSYA